MDLTPCYRRDALVDWVQRWGAQRLPRPWFRFWTIYLQLLDEPKRVGVWPHWIGILLFLLWLASCQMTPTHLPTQPSPSIQKPFPSSITPAQPTIATVSPEPTMTLQATRTPFPTPTFPPSLPIVEPSPHSPQEPLPVSFSTIVYARKQSLEEPGQIWTLQYADGLLSEKLLVELSPAALADRLGLNYPSAMMMGNAWISGLSVSPDEQYMAVTLRGPEQVATLIIDPEGRMSNPVMPSGGGGVEFQSWIPGAQRIVVISISGSACGTIGFDGAGYTGFPLALTMEATALLDGKHVIFSQASEGVRFGVIDLETGALYPYALPDPLPGSQVFNLAPSPDGFSCAYTWWDYQVSPARGAGQIWIAKTDGTNQRSLGPANTADFDLAWAPDQSTLAFVRQENPVTQVQVYNLGDLVSSLWLIDVANGQERPLLSSEEQYAHWSPKWLPDGSGLVFLSDRGGEVDLWFIRPDGTGLQQLTQQGSLAEEIAVLLK